MCQRFKEKKIAKRNKEIFVYIDIELIMIIAIKVIRMIGFKFKRKVSKLKERI